MPAISAISRRFLPATTYQAGSGTGFTSFILVGDEIGCTHDWHREQILNADAIGPRFPAIMGKTDDTSHQRLKIYIRHG